MPASCQLTSSHLAFSSTSTGIVAGPAPKLKMRAAGLTPSIVASLAGRGLRGGLRLRRCRGLRMRRAVAVGAAALLLVAVHDVLQARELLARIQVDERHALRRAAHL